MDKINASWCARCSQAPWQVRAASFAAVADALGACMATRHRLFHERLWREAAGVWPAVVAAGLPAVRARAGSGLRQGSGMPPAQNSTAVARGCGGLAG